MTTTKTVPTRCKFLHTALFPTSDAENIFSLSAPACNFKCQKVKTQAELLKQYEVWETNAKEYLVACKKKLFQLQETCYTEPVVKEVDIELWSVIVPLNLIIFSVSFAFPPYSLYFVVRKFY